MGNFRIYCEEEAFSPDNVSALEKAMDGFVESDVLSFPALEDIKGAAIRGADYPFETDEEGNLLIGSIVVCCDRAKEQANEYGHSYNRELHYLLVHGIMHCLGYDHMTDEDKAEMREKEEEILVKLGITRE